MKTVIVAVKGWLGIDVPPPLPDGEKPETTSPFVRQEVDKEMERLERRLEALRVIKERV